MTMQCGIIVKLCNNIKNTLFINDNLGILPNKAKNTAQSSIMMVAYYDKWVMSKGTFSTPSEKFIWQIQAI